MVGTIVEQNMGVSCSLGTGAILARPLVKGLACRAGSKVDRHSKRPILCPAAYQLVFARKFVCSEGRPYEKIPRRAGPLLSSVRRFWPVSCFQIKAVGG